MQEPPSLPTPVIHAVSSTDTGVTPEECVKIRILLRSISLLHHLDLHQREILLTLLKPVTFKKGKVIVRAGEIHNAFYIVRSGKVEHQYVVGEGRESIFAPSTNNKYK